MKIDWDKILAIGMTETTNEHTKSLFWVPCCVSIDLKKENPRKSPETILSVIGHHDVAGILEMVGSVMLDELHYLVEPRCSIFRV